MTTITFSHEQIQETLSLLAKHFPTVFNEKYLPLKIGIIDDILSALKEIEIQIDIHLLRKSIKQHCKQLDYLNNVKNGNVRYDLKGNPVEEIKSHHKTWSGHRYNKRYAKLYPTQRNDSSLMFKCSQAPYKADVPALSPIEARKQRMREEYKKILEANKVKG